MHTINDSMDFTATRPSQLVTQRPSTTGGPRGRGGRRAIITVVPQNASVGQTESSVSRNPGSAYGARTNEGRGAPLTIVFDSINSIGDSQSLEKVVQPIQRSHDMTHRRKI